MLTAAAAGVVLGLLWWGRVSMEREAVQQTLDRMDRDVATAKAAADAAAASAAEAQKALNAFTGSS